jgi:putative transposase
VRDAWPLNAVNEVQTAANDWLSDYNEYRPHDALGNVLPAVFQPRVFQ